MTLRLVFVSVVACIGLSFPTAERLERWMRGGHDGGAGVVIGGHGEALDGAAFVVVADALDLPVSPPPQAAPRSVVATPTAAAAAAPGAPVSVAEGVDAAVEAAWLEAVAVEAAPPAATAPETTAVGLSEPAPEPEPAPLVTEEADEELASLSAQESEGWGTPAAAPAAPPARGAEAPAVAVTEAHPPTPAPSADDAFRDVVEEMVASFTRDNDSASAEAPAVAAFEPMVIEDEPADVAYALNRASDGLSLPADEPAAVKATEPRQTRLAQAVRLTREAVNAWASLLHGPALVTLGR